MYRKKTLKLSKPLNSLDYLEKTFFFIQKTETDLKAWKWVILCLHSTIYNLAISALEEEDREDEQDSKKKKGQKPISLDTAIRRVQSPNQPNLFQVPLQLSEEEKEALRFIKRIYKDFFEHSQLKDWDMEISKFPSPVTHALQIISSLVFKTQNNVRFNESQKRKIQSFIQRGQNLLKRSLLLY